MKNMLFILCGKLMFLFRYLVKPSSLGASEMLSKSWSHLAGFWTFPGRVPVLFLYLIGVPVGIYFIGYR
jgi:hypothetical protein